MQKNKDPQWGLPKKVKKMLNKDFYDYEKDFDYESKHMNEQGIKRIISEVKDFSDSYKEMTEAEKKILRQATIKQKLHE